LDIKLNKEIREYQESIFFGLSFRQFACSISAVGVAAGVYFALDKPLGKEAVSWLCILGAAPFAMAGFFKYNGMVFEKFARAWLKSQYLYAKRRVFKSENYFYNLLNCGNKKEKTPERALRREVK
jgi:hypothetical protein